ncbi:MAG: transporter substrate-binding domain-containing protein [Coriobacteriaceae bacterium]|nr:transporter substrate-binding domain-containing protein [Coriobacteriaceae bacterium]
MLFRRIGVLVVAILALSFVLTGCGESSKEVDSLKRVQDSKELTVVGSGGYKPFNFIEEGQPVGFDVDTGKAIAERLGVELNYVTSDWDGLVEGLKAGRYDGILGSMAITEERQKEVDFTIPYYYSGAQLVVRADSGITNPEEMAGKSIAVATGTNFVQDAESLGATVQTYQDDNATIMELINGRVDGVITDKLVAIDAMSTIQGGEDLMLCGEIMRLEQMAIAINKADTELLAEINKILQELHDEGVMTEISKKWLNGVDVTTK